MQQGRVTSIGDRQHLLADVETLPARAVPTAELVVNEDIRKTGVDPDHVRVLANCADDLPPILVQETTMRVIDGMHRLRAAQARGDAHIEVRFLDVDDENAYLRGVAANVTHGLPLSLGDRKTAATRIIRVRPEWSDRAIARTVGLSDKTVAALRSRPSAAPAQPARRTGMDGRARPVDGTAGRDAARRLLLANPNASLRDTARQAGISPGTVRKVRNSLNGDEPWPQRPDSKEKPKADANAILASLRQDPSLKYRISGRRLLQALIQRPGHVLDQNSVMDIPNRWLPHIATLARIYAQEWLDFADMLERSVDRQECREDNIGVKRRAHS